MSRPLFLPSMRQTACLAAVGVAALACGFALRYGLVEQSSIGLACEGGQSFLCQTRRGAIALFTPQLFGYAALAAALLNLVRPSVVLCAMALIAGGIGIVLYNVALSALAIAVLILSLARPAPEPD